MTDDPEIGEWSRVVEHITGLRGREHRLIVGVFDFAGSLPWLVGQLLVGDVRPKGNRR